jgi:phosphoribosylamine--glycine ligase
MKKIAIIGSGGREHALAWKFAQSVGTENVFTLPGNGGIPNSHKLDITNFHEIERFCIEHEIDLIFVGPEQPLSKGMVDYFIKRKIRIFGPDKNAAQLESSKIFAKEFMKKYGVATSEFHSFIGIENANRYIDTKQGKCVIKYDGLAGGKGVFVCSSIENAYNALHEIKNQYGEEVFFLIEEIISGDEISIIGFTDGNSVKLLQVSQDHKQLNDGDKGPNTGGMGAYSPVPGCSPELMAKINDSIIQPTLTGIRSENMNYKGVIYFGIMVSDKVPYLLEYNVRFGDPETEVLLPSLKTDLLKITEACLDGRLDSVNLEFEPGFFADVVLVSNGYPQKYERGDEIIGLDKMSDGTLIFHAGTKSDNGTILTDGGRVLNIVCKGYTLEEAVQNAYHEISKIRFNGMYYRNDIGKRKNTNFNNTFKTNN